MICKICKKCNKKKLLSHFHKAKKGRNGLHSRCKLCRSIERREFSKSHPEYAHKYNSINARKFHLQKSYGLSLDKYNEMCLNQNNQCAICNKVPKILCVDHEHSTGIIRGLLCHACNKALGLLEDNPELFNKSIQYLDRSKKS